MRFFFVLRPKLNKEIFRRYNLDHIDAKIVRLQEKKENINENIESKTKFRPRGTNFENIGNLNVHFQNLGKERKWKKCLQKYLDLKKENIKLDTPTANAILNAMVFNGKTEVFNKTFFLKREEECDFAKPSEIK